MPYTRLEARYKIAELLRAATLDGGAPAFAAVWEAQIKDPRGYSPVAMVWDGPLWYGPRRPTAIESATLRVGFLIDRTSTATEVQVEDYLDRCADLLMDIVRANIELPGYWTFLEFAQETFLDFPPIETGKQYRREIFDLRAHFDINE